MTVPPRVLHDLAVSIARDAGELVRSGRTAGMPDADTKSSLTDVVTEYDNASEQLIVDRLSAARPLDSLVGEEGTSRAGTSGVEWLIDPIDGTTNYLYGLAGYAVSIAALDAAGGVAGAVYLPATDEMFSAWRGGGAWLLEATTPAPRPIRCSSLEDPSRALIGTGFGYRSEQRADQGRRVARLLPQVRDIRRFGAAAADLCYVASGRLDGYFEQFLNPWDLAAGALIAAEAGATVGSYQARRGEPDGVLVAAPSLYAQLRTLIVEAGTD